MTTVFYLVRHALKEKAIGDVSISSEGLRQAYATASHFRDLPISRIFSSPLNRARQTADIIGRGANRWISTDARLRERANWGDLPEQTFEEFVEMWDRCTNERDFSPPVGDSARGAGERLSSCLTEWTARYPEEQLIIVTHGGLITDFLVNEFSPEELNQKHPNFINEQSHLVSECSITVISRSADGFRLIDFANTAHLTSRFT
ncbi:histidine phosphatase family protein [Paenibacillus sp. GCM10023248]|uniref:histidine phosphatase family protein n=1 Tax=unclassified Paenibacillus TaxID=185978 RepID=UPI0023799058|nr:histidine phosphatase family protein [Paenibacillus sp. MAHUQ-63]MDD9268375.1 histidine phosphatase family protein [Paenibacillus sp. MAHUQ-63]